MLTSRRTEMQPAGGVGNGYNQLRPRLVPEAGLRGGGAEWIQQLSQSCLGKLSQVPPAPGAEAAWLAHRNPEL